MCRPHDFLRPSDDISPLLQQSSKGFSKTATKRHKTLSWVIATNYSSSSPQAKGECQMAAMGQAKAVLEGIANAVLALGGRCLTFPENKGPR